jgi:hypothetical protein
MLPTLLWNCPYAEAILTELQLQQFSLLNYMYLQYKCHIFMTLILNPLSCIAPLLKVFFTKPFNNYFICNYKKMFVCDFNKFPEIRFVKITIDSFVNHKSLFWTLLYSDFEWLIP